MVYCGKPSKGCSNCRERKIRCDQREPGCGQCEKRAQRCPGYRNLVDLMFRDESSHVIKKARAKARNKPAPLTDPIEQNLPLTASAPASAPYSNSPLDAARRAPLTIDTTAANASAPRLLGYSALSSPDDLLPSPDSGSWPRTPMIALMYSLAPSCQERGTAFFFSRYVSTDDNACHVRFDFVYDIWKPARLEPDRQVDGVLASMTAVGLLGLANTTRSGAMMEAARKSYGTALRLTNHALQDRVEAIADTTMLAVLVLSLFEMMTDHGPRTIRSWQGHIDGAAALAKMRGSNQFRSKAGTRMFIMLYQSLLISCVQQVLPMPQSMVDMRNELGSSLDQSEPTWKIGEPIHKAMQLRCDMKNGRIKDPHTVISKLLSIEEEFEDLVCSFPESWRYRYVPVTRLHSTIFRDVCHVYPGMWHASIWNRVRAMRILVLESILGEFEKLFVSMPANAFSPWHIDEFERTEEKLRMVCDAVIDSVPQHFRLLNPIEGTEDAQGDQQGAEWTKRPLRSNPSPASARASMKKMTELLQGRMISRGITMVNPIGTENNNEEVERFLLLTSARHQVVWPLYVVAMCSACTPAMKSYILDRLNCIYEESGQDQAEIIAELIRRFTADSRSPSSEAS